MSSEEELEKAVLVITSDDALGYTIEKVFGIVNGIGSTAGAGRATRSPIRTWPLP